MEFEDSSRSEGFLRRRAIGCLLTEVQLYSFSRSCWNYTAVDVYGNESVTLGQWLKSIFSNKTKDQLAEVAMVLLGGNSDIGEAVEVWTKQDLEMIKVNVDVTAFDWKEDGATPELAEIVGIKALWWINTEGWNHVVLSLQGQPVIDQDVNDVLPELYSMFKQMF
ncbi:hypothetical protein POM88_009357 [Heracleum sosnowskyi]|uniref:Uncharacterized protein n=1 Tax=Heracleum sosnowskyi TaxID=360622 RepID=A0AAD8J9U5_9APIA|nr:hypothetical protein POM88_009357 [Heracleum sosnowskyi]